MNDAIDKYLAMRLNTLNALDLNSLATSCSSTDGGSSSSSYIDDLLSMKPSPAMTNATTGTTSPNVTENVHVPTCEHVAEIVGRQGCKIKALRAKTNTYIKTPQRTEPPMFTITGRREDVLEARAEIQLAADHFTQIRASRRGSCGSSSSEVSVCQPASLSLSESVAGATGVLNDVTLLTAALMSTSSNQLLSQGKFMFFLHALLF
jgi:hypothetical protein